MTKQEKAIREFCGHHANWWPSTTQVQEMLALAQPEQYPQIAISPEIVGYVAPQRKPLTETQINDRARAEGAHNADFWLGVRFAEAAHGIKEKNNE